MPRVCSYPGARVRNSILHTYRIDAPAIAATAQSRAAADCFLVSGLAFPGSWRRRVAVCLLSAREVPITVNTRSCLLNSNSSTCSAGIRAHSFHDVHVMTRAGKRKALPDGGAAAALKNRAEAAHKIRRGRERYRGGHRHVAAGRPVARQPQGRRREAIRVVLVHEQQEHKPVGQCLLDRRLVGPRGVKGSVCLLYSLYSAWDRAAAT